MVPSEKQGQIQDCKGSDQNGAPGPRYALAWTRGMRGMCLPNPKKKLKKKKKNGTQFARFGECLLATFYLKIVLG